MKIFLLRWSDTGIEVVGPYDNEAAAAADGRKMQAKNNDDPRWTTVDLKTPDITPGGVAIMPMRPSIILPLFAAGRV